MSEFNQAKYIQEFKKENYDRCVFDVPKGEREKIQNHAKKIGYNSFSKYIQNLIKKDMAEPQETIAEEVQDSEEQELIQKFNKQSEEGKAIIRKILGMKNPK